MCDKNKCNNDSTGGASEKYNRYLGERKSNMDAIVGTDQQYDKALITLSAGALALSLTFVGKVSLNPIYWTKWVIAISWICFVISMLTTLLSFLTSKAACELQIKISENIFLETPNAETCNKYTFITKILNISSFIVFFVGVILLVIVAIVNITV